MCDQLVEKGAHGRGGMQSKEGDYTIALLGEK